MLSDIITLALAILGIIFILFCFIFRLMVWREGAFVFAVSLTSDNGDIYERIANLREISAFLGIQKQCTVAVINYGASEEFINQLKAFFSDYDFLKIISREDLITGLHT